MFAKSIVLLIAIKFCSVLFNKACEPVNTHNNFDCAHSFTFYKWDEEKKNAFRRDIISKLQGFNTLLTETDCSSAESIESLVDNFSSLIERSAEPYFKHTCSRKCGIVRNTAHKEWFDQECVVMKQRYVQALRSFNTSKTVENRHVLCNYKAEYKTLIRKKKRQFKIRKARELYDMRRKNPKQFWKHFNSQKCNISSNISADRFQEYFSTMLNTTLPTRIDEIEDFSNKSDLNEENPTYVSLSTPITTDEVRTAIRNLKRHKTSCPSDNLLNEYFLETVDILIGHITDCFNKVFDWFFSELVVTRLHCSDL